VYAIVPMRVGIGNDSPPGYHSPDPEIGMTISPDIAVLAAVTSAAGWTMIYAGARKRAIELRRRKRICPACGRQIVGRTCNAH
jgi:hypothetical protein